MLCDSKIGLLLLCCATIINCIQNKAVEKVYMKEVVDDLTNSASGYMYRSDGHSPATYVDLGGHPVPPKKYGLVHESAATKRQIVAPIYTQRYQPQLQPQPRPYAPQVAPTYYKPEKYVGYILPQQPVIIPQVQAAPVPLIEGSEDQENESFVKEGGSKYNQEQYAKHGETGAKGYNSKHEFDQGENGQHGKEEHQAQYDADAGRKAAYDNNVKYYSDADRAAQLAKGESYHESNGHKKGSKTEGFHNVYHKDEYKKDHTFYDESDNRGHYEKYGDEVVKHASGDGAHKSGGSSNAAYKQEHQGKQGHYDKGHYLNNAQGYKGADGKEQYYNQQEKYDKEGAQNDGKQYGYANSNSAGKYY